MWGSCVVDGEWLFERNLNRLQAEQAVWRRKHHALMRRKEAEAEKRRMSRPFTSDKKKPSWVQAMLQYSPSKSPGQMPRPSQGSSQRQPQSYPQACRSPRSNPPTNRQPMLPMVRSQSSGRPHTVDAAGAEASEERAKKMADSTGLSSSWKLADATGLSSMYSSVVNGTEDTVKRGNKNEPDSCMEVVSLSKKHCLSLEETKKCWDEFRSFDTKGRGCLSFEEFEVAVRKRCNLTADEEIPVYLLEDQCKKIGIASWVKFEAYLTWAAATAFSEEVMVPDAVQRRLRKLARTHGIADSELEWVKACFDHYDGDRSGVIDFAEFRQAVIELLHQGPKATEPNARTLRGYYIEIDKDCDGQIDFVEFLSWFLNMMAPVT